MTNQQRTFPAKTRTQEENKRLYPQPSEYTPKPVNPPNGIKTVDSSNPKTKIPMRP